MSTGKKNIIVDFEPISRRVYLSPGESLYEMLTKAGIQIRSLCGGKGSCGKCKVIVQKGSEYLNDLTDSELDHLDKKEIEKKIRLACQAKVNKSFIPDLENSHAPQLIIYLPDDLLFEDFKILTSGLDKGVEINPAIEKLFIKSKLPSLKEPIADMERTLSSLLQVESFDSKSLKFEFRVLQNLSEILRQGNHEVTLTVWNREEIIDCESGDHVNEKYGIAFDIGTTTIVGYLMNLTNGRIYSVASALNPQTAYGEDVISRITFIKDNKQGLSILNTSIIEMLNSLIIKTAKETGLDTEQIYEAVVVGNTVMHHIFMGLNPKYVGLSPYVPVLQQGLNTRARDLRLEIAHDANVYTLPLVAGFVGADTMGVILSSEIDKESKLTLALDIGTNGEIIVGNNKMLATGSCAAGSALEGAHIKDGMRAAVGAIDSVKIDPDDFSVNYSTINNKKPIGICGSGLIDVVAEMLKSKIIARAGNFNKEILSHERFINEDKRKEFILAYSDETASGKNVTISQKDVREIQMAKGAFYSGTNLILNALKKNYNTDLEIQQIFLAGAFGNYIDKYNAKFIGMIPDIDNDSIYQIGNAAGVGAQYCLLNKDLRKKAQSLLENIIYIEIAIQNDFQREYAEAMYFPHLKLENFPSLEEYKDIPKR